MRKQIYDNQEATGLRASLTAFFLSLYPRPHRFLILFFFFFRPQFLKANFDFPISGRDLQPFASCSPVYRPRRTHYPFLPIFFSSIFLSLPLFARYIRVTSFSIFFPARDVFFTALRTSHEEDSLTTSFSFAKWILTRTGTHTCARPPRPGCK